MYLFDPCGVYPAIGLENIRKYKNMQEHTRTYWKIQEHIGKPKTVSEHIGMFKTQKFSWGLRAPNPLLVVWWKKNLLRRPDKKSLGGKNYAHMVIVVAFLVVKIFSCLIIAS